MYLTKQILCYQQKYLYIPSHNANCEVTSSMSRKPLKCQCHFNLKDQRSRLPKISNYIKVTLKDQRSN